MRNIAIMCPSVLPVPSVKGGAIETIIDGLIRENEKRPRFHFTVFSEYDISAEEKSRQFKNTDFVFVKTNIHIEKLYYLFYRAVKKVLKISLPDNLARNKMVKLIDPDKFDWILYQAGEVFSLKYYSKKLPAEKVLVHAHGMITPIPAIDKHFSYYLSISEYVGRYWAQTSSRPSVTYKVWKNCIKVSDFGKETSVTEKKCIMEKLGIEEDDFVIIFTGRIIPEKGVLELIRALDYMRNAKVKLIIVGSARFAEKTKTKYEKEVQLQVEKCKDKIIFTGYIPNQELYKYYQLADVAAVPSIWDEPAGLVVIEAMAAGKPVVTTGSGGIREYVNENVAIFVERGDCISVDIANSIKYLMDNPEVRIKMGSNAREKAMKFDMSCYLERLDTIVKEISEV